MEKLEHHKEEVIQLQLHFQKEFENLSQRILEAKSEKFLKMNEENVSKLLNPLRERIESFEQKVEKSNKDQIAYSAALKEQLTEIRTHWPLFIISGVSSVATTFCTYRHMLVKRLLLRFP